MKLRLLACALAVAFVAPPAASAQSADSAAVLAVVTRLFAAMEARDTVTLRALLAPGTRFAVIRGDTAVAAPRYQSDTTFIRAISAGQQRLVERMWNPVVMVRGPLATVWAPYDFHIDGRRSHCGVDAFTLLRSATGWSIVSLAYTVERQGCDASPLGPPRP